MQKCTVKGCGRLAWARGWCDAHYRRWQRRGSTDSHKALRLRAARHRDHGHAAPGAQGALGITSEYRVWMGMRRRCRDPKHHAWKSYGGRGIKVCRRWDSFAKFLVDMGPKPTPKVVLDRIDNDGAYSPSNCRWATRKESAKNRRLGLSRARPHTHDITFRGKTQTLLQWSLELGVPQTRLYQRLAVYGWSVQRTLTESIGAGASRRSTTGR